MSTHVFNWNLTLWIKHFILYIICFANLGPMALTNQLSMLQQSPRLKKAHPAGCFLQHPQCYALWIHSPGSDCQRWVLLHLRVLREGSQRKWPVGEMAIGCSIVTTHSNFLAAPWNHYIHLWLHHSCTDIQYNSIPSNVLLCNNHDSVNYLFLFHFLLMLDETKHREA